MANNEDGPFPILELPYVVKRMILPKLSVLDLYNLSHVSKYSKDWVKDYFRNKNYRLKIETAPDYKVSLLNCDNQGFVVAFNHCDDDGNSEFHFGNIPVVTKNEETAPNRMRIFVLSRRLDAQWDKNEAMKAFMAHLTEVFTKDVCIRILWGGEQKEKIIMDTVKDLQLNVHCFYTETKCSSVKLEEYPKCKRLSIGHGNINTRQMKSLLEQWMENGTMDYFEVAKLSQDFNINYIMRGHEYTTPPGFRTDFRNYSVTRADGVVATVTFTPEYTVRRPTYQGWRDYDIDANFVLKCRTDQRYFTCFGAN